MVNALNSRSILNIGNGVESSPSLHSGAKGREAHQFIMKPMAAKWPPVCNAAKGRIEAWHFEEIPISGI